MLQEVLEKGWDYFTKCLPMGKPQKHLFVDYQAINSLLLLVGKAHSKA